MRALATPRPLRLVLATALAACGGSTTAAGPAGGSGSVSGTVAGKSFAVASEIAVVLPALSTSTCSLDPDGGQACTSSSSGQAVGVILTNRSDATCAAAQAASEAGKNVNFAELDLLQLEVVAQTGSVTPGTYDIVPPSALESSGAMAMFNSATSTCEANPTVQAASGAVTITQLTATRVAGSYSAAFGTEGTFSGSFDVEICASVDAGAPATDAGPTPCTP